MRRLACIVICSAALQVLAPAPARAWFGEIDRWSGPGPFGFVDWQGRIACIEDPQPNTPATLKSVNQFETKKTKVLAAIAGTGCLTDWDNHPIASLNLKVAYWWSWKNDLQYAGDAEAPTVHVWQVEPGFSVFIDSNKFVELSSGAGVLAVRVRGNSLTRFYLKPIEVTLTPGATQDSRLARSFSVRFGIMIVQKGFDATDFGAIPGTFHTDKEIQATVSVGFDPSRWR